MTYSRENFIKALFACGKKQEYVSNKSLADKLSISPAAVSDMIGKLVAKKLVVHIPYKGCRLTETGQSMALKILRFHRLWEVFLVEYLEFSPFEAHREAEQLEHATTLELAKKLDIFLKHPQYCPEGFHIPAGEDVLLHHHMSPLIEMRPGQKGVIHHIINKNKLMDYLHQIGIKQNMSIEFLEVLAYGGGVNLLIDKVKIQVSDRAAALIFVSVEDK